MIFIDFSHILSLFSLISERIETNKERLRYLNHILASGGLESDYPEISSIEEDPDLIIEEKNHLNVSSERKSKIKDLKDITEILLKAQNIIISSHFQQKKANLSELQSLINEIKLHISLENYKEISILITEYKEYEAISHEINLKIMLKNDYLTKEKLEFERYLKNNLEKNSENIINFWLEKQRTSFLDNYSETQAFFLLNKLSLLCIDVSKSSNIILIDSQIRQLKLVNSLLMSTNSLKPEEIEKFIKESLGFIVISKDMIRLFDIYSEYKLWRSKLAVFENIRKNCKITQYILQDKLIKNLDSDPFIYLSNNIILEISPQIVYNNTNYHLFELLSMEYLANLIKEAKGLFFMNLSEILVELDGVLKKSYHFEQTLKYIYEAGVSKLKENSVELEYKTEEIVLQMEECNLFFPIYFSFETQRKKIVIIRNYYGFSSQDYKHLPMPYSAFEEDLLTNYKEKALHDVYKFLEEKQINKESLRLFSEYFYFFEKTPYKALYVYEYKVLKDLNTFYLFLMNIISLSSQYLFKNEIKEEIIGNHSFYELFIENFEMMQEKYSEYSNLDDILDDCTGFIKELFIDARDLIRFDWEKHLELIDKDLVFYENENFEKMRGLMGKYKLFLWLKQIFKFFENDVKDYSKYYHLKLIMQELTDKYGLFETLNKEVLYDQFMCFSVKIEEIIEEISKNITNRLKYRILINEEEIPKIEMDLKRLKEKITDLTLYYHIATNTIKDFENCCQASKKAGVLFSMIVKENKKIDFNALKILIDFAKNFEFCELFPNFINLKNVFEHYESLILRVSNLKDSFFAKKQMLAGFKVPNLKVMQEKIICSEKVSYTSKQKFIIFLKIC